MKFHGFFSVSQKIQMKTDFTCYICWVVWKFPLFWFSTVRTHPKWNDEWFVYAGHFYFDILSSTLVIDVLNAAKFQTQFNSKSANKMKTDQLLWWCFKCKSRCKKIKTPQKSPIIWMNVSNLLYFLCFTLNLNLLYFQLKAIETNEVGVLCSDLVKRTARNVRCMTLSYLS